MNFLAIQKQIKFKRTHTNKQNSYKPFSILKPKKLGEYLLETKQHRQRTDHGKNSVKQTTNNTLKHTLA